MPYEPVIPGKWFAPINKGYRMACCDCGLVHIFDFRIKDGDIELRAFRDNRRSAAIRRKPQAYIKRPAS